MTKKKTYRQACELDIANGNSSKFTAACKRRFPELAGGKKTSAKKRHTKRGGLHGVSQECRDVLSAEMKKGNKKGAMKAYWKCRRAHEG